MTSTDLHEHWPPVFHDYYDDSLEATTQESAFDPSISSAGSASSVPNKDSGISSHEVVQDPSISGQIEETSDLEFLYKVDKWNTSLTALKIVH